jgi:hypothetical protein
MSGAAERLTREQLERIESFRHMLNPDTVRKLIAGCLDAIEMRSRILELEERVCRYPDENYCKCPHFRGTPR